MLYRVHRIKDTPRENFRWAAHTGGLAIVKLKDYDPGDEVEAATPYAAWKAMEERNSALRPGDLLEALDPAAGQPLQIAKYIGFEPAQWFVPEPKREEPVSDGVSAASAIAEQTAAMSGGAA
jgi:hypothetical protein